MKKFTCLLIFSLLLMGTSAAFGADVLYWLDAPKDATDPMETALNDPSLGLNVIVAVDSADFSALAAGKTWDLIVLSIHSSGRNEDFSNFEDHVVDGGRAILCDWDTDNADLFSLFGATTTDNLNETVITVLSNDLQTGLDENPLTITNQYWSTFSYGMSPLASEDVVMATFANGDAAIISSNGGMTIINGFLTDTVSDDVLFVNEIRYLLGQTSPGSSSGCNVSAFAPVRLLLLAPLALLLKKSR